MKNVELYGRVRYAVQIEGLSERAAARRFGIDPWTVNKMMKAAPLAGWRLPEEFAMLRRLLEVRMGKQGKRDGDYQSQV
jgi:transposase